ncbi:hypothetical protein [Paucibacter sp. Y2R2-4]|uniref:hypothetical protein n=1 Tax=Paucibacter sp. Y2R2-4 TaxID=2893553 RepID=UPI0021E380D0|nr:hypothetical protein [Paucibacter sp. Y2R2-4]MCV2351992.1 hypothetical protein [Paucibacter sp. Y2R2-4]
MTATEFFYRDIFQEFRFFLLLENPKSTREITVSIKEFFKKQYSDKYTVLCSHDSGSEFLLDIMVAAFDPKSIIEKNTLNVSSAEFSVFVGVESELGGVGASSPYGVMKNVVEDYLKLLLVNVRHRVMVFTSLPYQGEDNHVESRVETLRLIYERTAVASGGVLLIHLVGSQPRSTQVQAQVSAASIRGFIISQDGKSVVELSS